MLEVLARVCGQVGYPASIRVYQGSEVVSQGDAHFGINSPRAHGHAAVDALEAMREGKSKALISLGENLAVAMPDPEASFAAFRNGRGCGLS